MHERLSAFSTNVSRLVGLVSCHSPNPLWRRIGIYPGGQKAPMTRPVPAWGKAPGRLPNEELRAKARPIFGLRISPTRPITGQPLDFAKPPPICYPCAHASKTSPARVSADLLPCFSPILHPHPRAEESLPRRDR